MIINNPNIFYMMSGLINDEYTNWASFDGYVYELITEIQKIKFDDNVKKWFDNAKLLDGSINPYWPRGFAMVAAAINHPQGLKNHSEHEQWLFHVPDVLEYMKSMFENSSARQKWDEIISSRHDMWLEIVDKASEIMQSFSEGKAPIFNFAPNLLVHPYETNFITVGNSITIIAYEPDVESMLHEACHVLIRPYTHYFENCDDYYFADYIKMADMGYYAEGIIEECFVRAISTVLAGGGVRRLATHANQGFGAVPYIGQQFEQGLLSIDKLEHLILEVIYVFMGKYPTGS